MEGDKEQGWKRRGKGEERSRKVKVNYSINIFKIINSICTGAQYIV